MRIILIISLSVQFLLGIMILLLNVEKKAYEFFISLIYIVWSILDGLFVFVFPFDVKTVWPVYLITTSIFLVIAGLRKYKRIKFGYFIPSLALFCMGILFSLFSFDFIKVPFRTVAIALGPIVMACLCVSLVLFFFIQQRHKELIINDSDSGDFDDEELSFPKID